MARWTSARQMLLILNSAFISSLCVTVLRMNLIFWQKRGLFWPMLTFIPALKSYLTVSNKKIYIFKIIFNFQQCYKKEQIWYSTKLNMRATTLLIEICFCIKKDQGRFMKTNGSNSQLTKRKIQIKSLWASSDTNRQQRSTARARHNTREKREHFIFQQWKINKR